MTTPKVDVLIVGGGPTGIGAALACDELGLDYLLLERSDFFGGLATSTIDDAGFTWDMGGHVSFSHYELYDHYMQVALGPQEWLKHERRAAMLIGRRWVPYPAQQHLSYLDQHLAKRCMDGLRAIADIPIDTRNYERWLRSTFGSGICDGFLVPYNSKVWAHPLSDLSCAWVGERVARPEVHSVSDQPKTPSAWGPNASFHFPAQGGTGAIWNSLGRRVRRAHLRTEVVAISPSARTVATSTGRSIRYRYLISTMPLNVLSDMTGLSGNTSVNSLRHTQTHVIGVGMKGAAPADVAAMSWLYFADQDIPFYRATVFSNYSPAHVPGAGMWSLMFEVAESSYKLIGSHVVEDVVKAAVRSGLIDSRGQILSLFHSTLPYGYPVPTLGRDATFARLNGTFEREGIFSRGRFGAWKYEVSNQDHSFMQGWECAHRLMYGDCSYEVTLSNPALVNSR